MICPSKAKFFMWCIMENKVTTWNTMKRRQIESLGWRSLCRANAEIYVSYFPLRSIYQAGLEGMFFEVWY